MTKKARPPVEIERIKDHILDQALIIITEDGYSALTMRALARRIGMTATSIYNYFTNKDEIYLMLVINGFEELYARLRTAYDREADPGARARALTDAYFTFGMERGPSYDIMFTLPTPKYDDFRDTPLEPQARRELELSMRLVELVRMAIRDLHPAGSPPTDARLEEDLVHVWSVLHGIISLSRSKVFGYVAEGIRDTYERLISDLIERVRIQAL